MKSAPPQQNPQTIQSPTTSNCLKNMPLLKIDFHFVRNFFVLIGFTAPKYLPTNKRERNTNTHSHEKEKEKKKTEIERSVVVKTFSSLYVWKRWDALFMPEEVFWINFSLHSHQSVEVILEVLAAPNTCIYGAGVFVLVPP